MAKLTDNNCSVDRGSGAVIFHKSPELIEIMKLRQEVKELNNKVDELIELLKGGGIVGQKVE